MKGDCIAHSSSQNLGLIGRAEQEGRLLHAQIMQQINQSRKMKHQSDLDGGLPAWLASWPSWPTEVLGEAVEKKIYCIHSFIALSV